MNALRHRSHPPGRQRGIVLATGLLLLVLITLVVLAASRSGRLQTVMAFNSRERDLAFQAAEAALLDGEARIATEFHAIFNAPATGGMATPATGLLNRLVLDDKDRFGLIVRGSTLDYWVQPVSESGYGWFQADGSVDSNKSIEISRNIAGVDEAPRFVIEYLGWGSECGAQTHYHYRYRITALATGSSTRSRKQVDTRVILQTEYRYCAE